MPKYRSFITLVYRFIWIGHDAPIPADDYSTMDWLQKPFEDASYYFRFYFLRSSCLPGRFCWADQPLHKRALAFVKSLPVLRSVLRRVPWSELPSTAKNFPYSFRYVWLPVIATKVLFWFTVLVTVAALVMLRGR